MNQALHGKPVDRLRVADRVAPGDSAAGFRDNLGAGFEDRRDRLAREVLGKGGDVDRQHDPAAHGEDVAARVGGRDRPEVGRIVDERREEVGGRHQRDVVAHLVDRGVVERGEPDHQCGIRGNRKLRDQIAEQRGSPFRGAAATRGPLGESQRLERQARTCTQATKCRGRSRRRGQVPVHSGGRFSANAFGPSLASFDPNTVRDRATSAAPRTRLSLTPWLATDQLLRGGNRQRGVASHPLGQLHRRRRPPAPGSVKRATMPYCERLLGGDRVGGDRHLHRLAVADAARQPQQPAGGGEQPDARLGNPELGALGGDEQVARQRQLQPTGEREPLDRADQRLRRAPFRMNCIIGPMSSPRPNALRSMPAAEAASGTRQDPGRETGVAVQLARPPPPDRATARR